MQYRWCTGKRVREVHRARPRGDSSPRGLVVVTMGEAIATALALWFTYLGWLWFRRAVHINRMERRQLYEPVDRRVVGAAAAPLRRFCSLMLCTSTM